MSKSNLPSWLCTDPAYWNRGIIPSRPKAGVPRLAAVGGNVEGSTWWRYARPVANQGVLPSCCGWAWAEFAEYLYCREFSRHIIPEGYHIDGEEVWRCARERYYGDLNGGLLLDQGGNAAIEAGIFPAGSRVIELAADLPTLSQQLQRTPVVAGSRIHAGWFRPSAENGCLDHEPRPGPGDGGHAWIVVGLIEQAGRWYVSGNTQWGPDYAYHGFFLMNWPEVLEGLCAPLASVYLPDGWLTWRGWENHLVKVSDDGKRLSA